MQVYEGMASVRDARCSISGSELGELVDRRIDELSGYLEFDAPSFVKMIVLEPPDSLAALNSALGFNLLERNCDVIGSHREWFELTMVLSDDGAGVIVFVPKIRNIDPIILIYCNRQMDLNYP